MGKGDQRTRRGKIYRGTFGKRRPKKKKRNTSLVEKKDSETAKKSPKKKARSTKTEQAKD